MYVTTLYGPALLALCVVGASPVGCTLPPADPAAPPIIPALPAVELVPPLEVPPLLVVPPVLVLVVPPVDEDEPPGPTGVPPVARGLVVTPPLLVVVVVVVTPPVEVTLVLPAAPLPNMPPVPSNWFLLLAPESLEQADASNTVVVTPKKLMVRSIGRIPRLVTNWLHDERCTPPERPGRN